MKKYITSPESKFSYNNIINEYNLYYNTWLQFFRIKHMKSTGVLQRLEDKWMRREINSRSDTTQQVPAPEVTFGHICGILLFYSSMILISVAVLGTEIMINRYLTQKTNHFHSSRPIHPFAN